MYTEFRPEPAWSPLPRSRLSFVERDSPYAVRLPDTETARASALRGEPRHMAHGMEWLHEAVAETYLPLLRVLGNLERDGVPAHFNINLSPILLEQLVHPVFVA